MEERETSSGGESMEVTVQLEEVAGVFSRVGFSFPSGEAARAHHVVNRSLRLEPVDWQGPEWGTDPIALVEALNTPDDGRFIAAANVWVRFTGCDFKLCENANCRDTLKRTQTGARGAPIKPCSVTTDDNTWVKMPSNGVLLLHHLKLRGTPGPATLTASLWRDTYDPTTPMPLLHPVTKEQISAKLSVTLYPKKEAGIKRKAEDLVSPQNEPHAPMPQERKKAKQQHEALLQYLGLKPQRGFVQTSNPVQVLFAPSSFVPARELRLAFKSLNVSVPARVYKAEGDPAVVIMANTPEVLDEIKTKTYIVDGPRKVKCENGKEAKYSFLSPKAEGEPKSHSASPPPFTINETIDDDMALCPSHFFDVYCPSVDGPLTLPRLDHVSKRKCYQDVGCTDLMIAAYVGALSIVESLVTNRNSDITKRDYLGRDAYWWAEHGWGGRKFALLMKEILNTHSKVAMEMETHREGEVSHRDHAMLEPMNPSTSVSPIMGSVDDEEIWSLIRDQRDSMEYLSTLIPEERLRKSEKRIVQGGSASVYGGTNLSPERGEVPVAIKVVSLIEVVKRLVGKHPCDPTQVLEGVGKYCAREAETLSLLNHPRVVKLYGACNLSNRGIPEIWVVTELIQPERNNLGILLDDLKIQLSLKLKLRILCDAAEGLMYISSKGVLHRDVRPESILLTKDLRGLIGDFGVAKVVTPSAQDTGSVGTMEYMAPEIIKGEKHTLAVDIYSFGLVIYHVLSGKAPKSRPILSPDILPFNREEIPQDTPTGLWGLMLECLESNPTRRPTWNHIHTKLHEIYSNVQGFISY